MEMRHKQLREEQDEQLEEISNIATNLHHHAEDIDVEISK